MKRGYLSEYFLGVAVKRLSAVEADQTRSNQHEYGATREMRTFMGTPTERVRLPTKFIYLSDDDDPVAEDAYLTYYDSRLNQPARRPEARFYFPTTLVSQLANEGDLLLLAKRRDEGLLVVIAEGGSSSASQLEWLFGFSQETFPSFSVRAELETEKDRIGLAATFILESIGVELEVSETSFLDLMLEKFDGKFPKTRDFSEFARSTLPGIDARDDPDGALIAWMEREEILFRTLERYLLAQWLANSFRGDVDDFMKISLSVQNRRKSRVGYALEDHLEVVLRSFGVKYTRVGVTENKARPDFLFPGQAEYHDESFPATNLVMLGVKSTCKDRWRQVLSEADRVEVKHLLTLEGAISLNQTREMISKKLQLVIPRSIQGTYTETQRESLMDVAGFIGYVGARSG